MEYKIENEFLEAVVCSKGCELVSVKTKKDGAEHIWQGDPDAWKRHAPVLFPLVGKYKDNKTEYQGKTYEMSQHGFARDMEFVPVSKTKDSIVMNLTDTKETLEKYPFHFELQCSFTLKGRSIEAGWKVINSDAETMYFSIGGHPAFICDDRQSKAGCEVVFGTKKPALSYKLLNEDGLVENEAHEMKLHESRVTVTEDFFDKDAYIFENSGCHEVSIRADGKTAVTVTFDAPVFGLWSPGGKKVPFICIEPGRSIVGDTGITLYTIGSVKTIPGYRTYVSIDGGMTDNPRYALYQSAYEAVVANKAAQQKDFTATIAGRCCESGDLIQENTQLQTPAVGDILAVLSTGAYNYSMASNYNRVPRLPVVMVRGGEDSLAVRRETYEDLVRNDV